MKCECCGAEVSPGNLKCEYCGAGVQPSGCPSRQSLFAHILQSPEYQRRDSPQRRAALPKHAGLAQAVPVVFFVVFIAISSVIAVTAFGMAGAARTTFSGVVAMVPLMMAVVPVGFVVLGVLMLRQSLVKARQFREAPLRAEPAVLIGKRTQVSGGSNNRSATTAYYLTAELADGARREYVILAPHLYGRIAEGDAGVLFSRASFALDFDRVSAPSE